MNINKLVVQKFYALLALSFFTLSANAFVLGPSTPGKWGPGPMGTGATVSYSFMATGTSRGIEDAGFYSAFSDFLPTGWEGEIAAAFDAWSAVADITFMEIADLGEAFNISGGSGDIRMGGEINDGPFGILAHGYYPPANGDSAAGDIHFDTAETWKIGFGGAGIDIFTVALHEIGHAIGLDHTAVPDSIMNSFYSESIFGLQADDIAGAQFIYGITAVPVPAAVWLLLSAFIASLGFVKRQTA